MSTLSCSTSFLTLSRPSLGLLASSSVMTWMSRPPALLETSARYILKPLSMGLPAGASAPVNELTQPILIGPLLEAAPEAAAAPDAAGLALAAPDAAGFALADAAAVLGLAAADAGAAALEAGAEDPPQAARARQRSPPNGVRAFIFMSEGFTLTSQTAQLLRGRRRYPRGRRPYNRSHASGYGGHAAHRRPRLRRHHQVRAGIRAARVRALLAYRGVRQGGLCPAGAALTRSPGHRPRDQHRQLLFPHAHAAGHGHAHDLGTQRRPLCAGPGHGRHRLHGARPRDRHPAADCPRPREPAHHPRAPDGEALFLRRRVVPGKGLPLARGAYRRAC